MPWSLAAQAAVVPAPAQPDGADDVGGGRGAAAGAGPGRGAGLSRPARKLRARHAQRCGDEPPDRTTGRQPAHPHARPTVRSATGGPPPRRFRLESNAALPVAAAERRDRDAEEELRAILAEQSFAIERIEVVHRTIGADPVARSGVAFHARVRDMPPDMIHDMMAQHLLVVAVKPQGQSDWLIARVRSPRAERILLGPLILQTLMIYIVLFGAVALILRRITRPLAALTRRVERFAASPDVIGQLPRRGPRTCAT
ncbi:hypothetical protein ACFSTD_04435 [Novosphingobium colocasiae]